MSYEKKGLPASMQMMTASGSRRADQTGVKMRPLSARAILPVVLLLAASPGCMAAPKVVRFGPTFESRSPNAPVEVFQTRLPDRPYIEVASISVGDTDEEYCMEQTLLKAREVGADAVILKGRVGTTAVAVPVGGVAYAVGNEYGLSAIAIRFK